MKTYAIDYPKTLLPLNDGNWHVNFNVTQEERDFGALGDEEPSTQYVYDTVYIEGKPTKTKIRTAMKSEGADKQTIDNVITEIFAK